MTAVFAEYAPLAEHIKPDGCVRLPRRRASASIRCRTSDCRRDLQRLRVDFWWGMFAPAKTPKEMVLQYADWSLRR